MGFFHGNEICDFRDYWSSLFCDLRDSVFCVFRNYLVVTDPQRHIKEWLAERLAALGRGAKSRLAEHLGVRNDAVTRMLNTGGKEHREISAHELQQMQEFFESNAPGEPKRRPAPLVGYVGAGSEAHLFDSGQGPFDEVEAPDGSNQHTVAVEVRGESLGSFFDRWLVFYDDVRDPVTHDLIGKLCVCGLPDGRVLIKKLARGSGPGLYTLLSQFESPIFDTGLLWAAKVKNMVPR